MLVRAEDELRPLRAIGEVESLPAPGGQEGRSFEQAAPAPAYATGGQTSCVGNQSPLSRYPAMRSTMQPPRCFRSFPHIVAATLILSTAPVAAQEVEADPAAAASVPAALAVATPDPRLGLGPLPRLATAPGGAASTTTDARRNDAMLNGALIALGTLGIIDNVVVHWILGWHRAIEDHPHTLEIEIGIVAASAAMLAAGIWRERRARALDRPD